MSYDHLSVTVTVGGTDVTAAIDPDRFAIASYLARAVDSAKLWLRDAGALGLDAWQEVVITDGAEIIFGGVITHLSEVDGADGGLDVEVTASDYGVLVTKVRNIKAEFDAATDAEMIAALFAEYLPEIDAATHVGTFLSYDRRRFNRVSLDAVLDDLAEAAGASWYVDYEKRLHFFATEDARAPYGLSDTPDWSTTFPFEALRVDTEGAGVVNRVEVVGGTYLSEDATFILPGTGQDNRVALPFKLHAPEGQTSVQVWRNTGTESAPVWTALTVKVGYIDELTGAGEVLYYYNEGVVEQQANWPALPNAVKVTGRYDVPLRARVRSQASYELYGRWFDDVIVDDAIVDKRTAKLAARGKLAAAAFGQVSITCDARQPGLRAGQTLLLTDSLRGLDGEYLIQVCGATIGVDGEVVYSLGLGAYDPDLVDLLVRLARRAREQPAWREDEVLDEIYQRRESVALVESTDVTTSAPPYLWDEFVWGYFSWS